MKRVLLYQILLFITHGKHKNSYNNNKSKISEYIKISPTWNEKFELPNGSSSLSDIQDYFEYIFKKYGENISNPSIKIYVNKIENRITFKIKNGLIH